MLQRVRPKEAVLQKPIWLRFVIVFGFLLGVIFLWRWSPIAEYVRPEFLAEWGYSLGSVWWGYLAAIGVFLASGLVVFPVTVLITASALIFGGLWGFAVAYTGSLVSATAGYLVGDLLGRQRMGLLSRGGRLETVSQVLARRGILSVAAIRQLPVAPFSVVNFAAGVSHIRFRDYLIGTAIGILPWVLALTLLTDQFVRMLRSPTSVNGVILAAVVTLVASILFFAIRVARRLLPGSGKD